MAKRKVIGTLGFFEQDLQVKVNLLEKPPGEKLSVDGDIVLQPPGTIRTLILLGQQETCPKCGSKWELQPTGIVHCTNSKCWWWQGIGEYHV